MTPEIDVRDDRLQREVFPGKRLMTESLYDKLGGFSMLRKVVLDFYNRVLDDPDLSPFFAEVKMAALVDHQRFLSRIGATLAGLMADKPLIVSDLRD